MVDLFNKSKLAGVTKKRKATEAGVGETHDNDDDAPTRL